MQNEPSRSQACRQQGQHEPKHILDGVVLHAAARTLRTQLPKDQSHRPGTALTLLVSIAAFSMFTSLSICTHTVEGEPLQHLR